MLFIVSGAGIILLDVSVIVEESVVVVSDFPLLLQAAIAPATAMIARIFFMYFDFVLEKQLPNK